MAEDSCIFVGVGQWEHFYIFIYFLYMFYVYDTPCFLPNLNQVCSDINKPNGQFILPNDRDAIMTFISSLPIRKVLHDIH